MPLDFPANPTNGQVYGSYVYNSTVGAWQGREDSATVAVTSPTAPASANDGDIWYNSNTGVSYVYYADGTSAQWVEIISSAVPALNSKANLVGDNSFSGGVNYFGSGGTNGTFISSNSGRAQFSTDNVALTPLTIRGIASQTVPLQEWRDSTNAVVARLALDGVVTAPRFISTQTTGTAPFTVASTTVVTNLNADLLDGQHGSVYSPAGMVSQFAGSSAPTGWLLCDGAAVSRATYATLFAAIGTTYGTGDGSTTFNVPNLQGRVPVGKSSSGTFLTLGSVGGAETVTLDATQIPSHTHTFSGTTSAGGAHSHQIDVSGTQLRYLNTSATASTGLGGLAGIAGGADNLRATAVGDHTHTYSGTTAANTGGGSSHNNLQPYIVMNYIIKV